MQTEHVLMSRTDLPFPEHALPRTGAVLLALEFCVLPSGGLTDRVRDVRAVLNGIATTAPGCGGELA